MSHNYIRSASSSRSGFSTEPTPSNRGSDVRKKLFEKFSSEIQNLEDLSEEMKDYLAIECSIPPEITPGQVKFIINTVMPAPAAAKRICGLGTIGLNGFYLPYRALDDHKEWEETFPRFERWLVSSFRFPHLVNDRLLPKWNAKNVNQVDFALCYSSVLTCSAKEFFKNGERTEAVMLWKVLRGMCHFVPENAWKVDPKNFEKLSGILPSLLERKMAFIDDAIKFDQLGNDYSVAEYTAGLFQSAVLRPDLATKSVIHNLALLLPLLYFVPSNVLTLGGIQNTLLRMVVERSFHHIKLPSLQNVFKIEEAIQILVRSFSRSMFSSLKYWAYWITFVRELRPGMTQNQFVERATQVREFIHCLPEGILPLCYVIDPDSQRYLTESSLAELCLARSEFNSSVLTGYIFSEHTQPLALQKLIQGNLNRLAEQKAKIESLGKRLAESSLQDSNSSEPVNHDYGRMEPSEIKELWKRQSKPLGEIKYGLEEQLNQLYAATSRDDVWRVLDLIKYYECCNQKRILIRKRMVSFVIRVAPTKSKILSILPKLFWNLEPHEAKIRVLDLRSHGPTHPHARKIMSDLIQMARGTDPELNQLSKGVQRNRVQSGGRLPAAALPPQEEEEEEEREEEEEPLPHIPPEEAKLIFNETLARELPDQELECYVCMEVTGQLVPLHSAPGHDLCSVCKSKLTRCPLCRSPITQ